MAIVLYIYMQFRTGRYIAYASIYAYRNTMGKARLSSRRVGALVRAPTRSRLRYSGDKVNYRTKKSKRLSRSARLYGVAGTQSAAAAAPCAGRRVRGREGSCACARVREEARVGWDTVLQLGHMLGIYRGSGLRHRLRSNAGGGNKLKLLGRDGR